MEPVFFSSSTSSAAPSSRLVLPPVEAVVLRLQLKAQGGVDGDDAAAGGNTEGLVCYLQTESAEDPLPVDLGHLSGVDPFTQTSETRTQRVNETPKSACCNRASDATCCSRLSRSMPGRSGPSAL